MNMNDVRVISNFIVQALKGENITVYGEGKQTRSFQYVDDLIGGMIRMMETEDNVIGPVNIGNLSETSILDLAKKIVKLTNSNSKLLFKELPQDDPMQRKPDISLAKKLLNNW